MKKLFVLPAALFACSLMAATASADMLIADIDIPPLDTDITNTTLYGSYWGGILPGDIGDGLGDTNPDQLHPDNPTAEEAWVEALYGQLVDVTYIGKIEFDPSELLFFDEWDPDSMGTIGPWDVVVLKAGGTSYAIEDTDLNDLLTFPDVAYDGEPFYPYLPKGTSHLTFFSTTSAPVPEPATMLLFGTGLIGLAGLRRKMKKK